MRPEKSPVTTVPHRNLVLKTGHTVSLWVSCLYLLTPPHSCVHTHTPSVSWTVARPGILQPGTGLREPGSFTGNGEFQSHTGGRAQPGPGEAVGTPELTLKME